MSLVDLAVGLLLLAGAWDGLYDALDLPQAKPALFAQAGGAALWDMPGVPTAANGHLRARPRGGFGPRPGTPGPALKPHHTGKYTLR
jgi:hypothetical protein